jgi:hypothetical protein
MHIIALAGDVGLDGALIEMLPSVPDATYEICIITGLRCIEKEVRA